MANSAAQTMPDQRMAVSGLSEAEVVQRVNEAHTSRRIVRERSEDAEGATDGNWCEVHFAWMAGGLDAIPVELQRPWWRKLVRMVSGPHMVHEAQPTSVRLPPFPLAVQTSREPGGLADGLCPRSWVSQNAKSNHQHVVQMKL